MRAESLRLQTILYDCLVEGYVVMTAKDPHVTGIPAFLLQARDMWCWRKFPSSFGVGLRLWELRMWEGFRHLQVLLSVCGQQNQHFPNPEP